LAGGRRRRADQTQGKVIDTITEVQTEYYGFDESDFPGPSSDA
jgi:hypothetical protein